MGRGEAVIFGLRAALAVGEHRPDAIRRVFHDRKRRRAVSDLLSVTASRRRPYREVEDDELRRIAGSNHHEGVVVVCDPMPVRSPSAIIDLLPPDAVVLALDGVNNPHNQGAIVRSAAWFGASAVLLGGHRGPLNQAAIRVAQGGAEVVPVAGADDLAPALRHLIDRGYAIVGADQRAKQGLFQRPLPRPVCVVMGNEAHGLSRAVRSLCTATVAIPGTGAVESLNVSVSAGILLAAATID